MTESATRAAALHMLQLWLDSRRLAELAKALHLPMRAVDDGYLVHCALGEVFGDDAPGPFSLEDRAGPYLRVLAYGDLPDQRLQTIARTYASPMAYRICDWSRLASKPMPDAFATGTRLRFELCACPVVRMHAAGKHHRAGAEVDAFLRRVWLVDDPSVPVRREHVYRRWLIDRLEQSGGARAEPDAVRLERFSLRRMLRRGAGGHSGRKAHTVKRPAATLSGTLQVARPHAFRQLLRRGIGRHKSFGFGMLKLRPPGR